MTHGIPQGSILGPRLFILFMNDLPLHVESELDTYADDTTLCAMLITTYPKESKHPKKRTFHFFQLQTTDECEF